ncbi:MAG TPA: hypothetical protein VGM90_26160 [Kofleriaceae bacterium]|jgi:hypothetical protein
MRFVTILALLSGACGDNASPCDYDEQDDLADGTAAEATTLSAGSSTQMVCGRIEGGHYDAVERIVDVDRYRIAIAGSGGFSVAMAPLEGRQYLTSFAVKLFDTAPNPTLVADAHMDLAHDHGAFAASVAPGDYDLVVAAGTDGDISGGSIDYRVRIAPDPSIACTAQTKATYTERDEQGNDAVTVNFARTPLAAPGPGTAEATAITLAPYGRYAVKGAAHSGADTDVFAVKTAKGTNELTVRLDWTEQADLDYLVVEADTLVPAGVGVISGVGQLELATFAVKPDTRYLLVVGAAAGAPADASYTATVCTDHVSL